ncbi:MAG: hypothetical protein HQK66_08245 [Desulfamplus sp.]|nr:hypothetical protein [Desulfamplus sp.]
MTHNHNSNEDRQNPENGFQLSGSCCHSHSHGESHTHSRGGHTHCQGDHAHSHGSHTHSQGDHTHSQECHTHSHGGCCHGEESKRAEMGLEDKLMVLLKHWIDHNDSHMKTYLSWAEKAREGKLDKAAHHLEGAARASQEIGTYLGDALKNLGK